MAVHEGDRRFRFPAVLLATIDALAYVGGASSQFSARPLFAAEACSLVSSLGILLVELVRREHEFHEPWSRIPSPRAVAR